MMNRVAVSVVSIVVVLGVIIGVTTVSNSGHAGPNLQGPSKSSTGPMKTVTSICELTQFKGSCVRSLAPIARNATATSKDYVVAVVEAALIQVNSSSEATYDIVVDKEKDKVNYLGLEDCKVFLHLAWDRLQDALVAIHGCPDLNTLEQDKVHELLTWVTGVYALHSSCVHDIDDPQFKSVLQIAIQNSTELTHNAVNVVAELPRILKLFHNTSASVKKLALSPVHLRSMDDDNDTGASSSYPTWFNAVDRRLLAMQQVQQIKPDVVVAKDGSGQYKTIMEAVAAYPVNHKGRFIIQVKAGVYREQVKIDNSKPNVFMYGDGIGKTVITGRRNFGYMGIKTMHSATFANEADGFMARGMTFRNEAGPKGYQAVAFRSMGDKTAVFDCCFEGYQDTLFYQVYRQFYRNCLIYGTIDIIFGKGEAVIQDTEIIVRKPMENQINTVTADGKEIMRGSNGLVLQNCRIVPHKGLYAERFQILTYLGRPWTPEATTVVMQTELGDFIRPEGWMMWNGTLNHKTCHMYEHANRGPGATTKMRNKDFPNFKVLNADEAANYTVAKFLAGAEWLPQTGFPHRLTL